MKAQSSYLWSALKNLLLVGASAVAFLLVCELIVFRLIVPASDMPDNAYIDGVIRYAPDQTGMSRFRDGSAVPFAINRQGWNSAISDYRQQRSPGVARIAVIGDSYVEAFQVPFDASFAELTQEKLHDRGCPVEIYRFGLGGAPLSQYLLVLEREVAKYHPDWVVVLLIDNDFDESFDFMPGRHTSSFLKLRISNGEVKNEIAPVAYHPGIVDWVRKTATMRYILYTRGIRLQLIRDLVFGRQDDGDATHGSAASEKARLNDIGTATTYLFDRMATVAREHGIQLLYLIDGDRRAIYGDRDEDWTREPLVLNRTVAELTELRRMPFIDLHEHFARDWGVHRQRFEFEHDWHWNGRAHRLVADVLTDFFSSRCSEAGKLAIGAWPHEGEMIHRDVANPVISRGFGIGS